MNRMECANCLVHDFKQPVESALFQCTNCKLIYYCGKECQSEHWAKVHKDQCKYFADPSLNELWQHREKDCIICLKADVAGESIKLADNPNYECILQAPFPPNLTHPHPFPVAGQPGDIREKAIIVLMQLVRKFQVTHPEVARDCTKEFLELNLTLRGERIGIWRDRKIYPRPQAQIYECSLLEKISDIVRKMIRMHPMEIRQDPFELWQTICLIERIINSVRLNNLTRFLKDPLVDLPDDIKKLTPQSLNNAPQYLEVANKILEALTNQVIRYKEVLKIVGGGSLKQECSFCSKDIDISVGAAKAYFTKLLLGTYSCGNKDCEDKGEAAIDDQYRLESALLIMWLERKVNKCDFCFRRTPVKQEGSDMRDIHRCSHCHTAMYCSEDCLYQDDGVHVIVCRKDKQGRKKKPNASDRRRMAREKIEKKEMHMESYSQIFCEVFELFKLKNASKEQ